MKSIKQKLLLGSIVALPFVGVGGFVYANVAGASPTTITSVQNDAPGGAQDVNGPDTVAVPGTTETDAPGGHQDLNGTDANFQSGAPDATEVPGTSGQ